MKKAALVVLVASFATIFMACGAAEDNSCETSENCVFGEVCVDLRCIERPCNGKGDCVTGEVCIPGELVGKEPGMKYCSAPCSELKPCELPLVCGADGICKTNSGTEDIVEDSSEPEDVVRDVAPEVAADVPVELPPIEVEVDCKTCTTTVDCGTGYSCQPVGAEKHCLRDCNNDGDCLAAYTCYASGTQKSCLPVSYNCVPCSFDAPCQDGQCCDFGTGQCKDCRGVCFTCTYDYDCAAGLRCYKETGSANGFCVEECSETECTDTARFECSDNGKGVDICQPTTEGCGGCSEPTPFPFEGGCVDCRNTDDCGANEMCNTLEHKCVPSTCGDDTIMCEADMKCHQCCTDDDCLRFPEATGVCLEDGTCQGVEPCGGLCTDDFPICALVQGVEQCVQCAIDTDCQAINSVCTCVGDPLYSCIDDVGAICQSPGVFCQATCEDAGDCPPTSTGGAMECAMINGGTTGFCYDPVGDCDGSVYCCAPGKKCFDLILLMNSGMMGSTGGTPMDPSMLQSGSGYCECSVAEDCINGKSCTDMSVLCVVANLVVGYEDLVCPGGVLSPTMPPKLCVDFADLLAGIF